MDRIRPLFSLLSLSLLSLLHAQQISFSDVATAMGISHSYPFGLGAGVSFCDIDGDGQDDISLPSDDGQTIWVYQNRQNYFIDISKQLGVLDTFESNSILWADYDNDGDKDVFIANATGGNRLYQNQNMVFTDVTGAAGITVERLGTTAICWVDYDNDGWLDLYVCNYEQETDNILYRNNGNGAFSDVTLAAGVAAPGKRPLAAAFLDIDNDGWLDIYLAHDRGTVNTLFHNNGDGTFSDISSMSNTDLVFNAMGIAVGDYNNDGFSDMYITNTAHGNALLRNNRDNTFTDVADSLGVILHKLSWGANFFDYDNDLDLDLFISVQDGDPSASNVLYQNQGDGNFVQTSAIGFDLDTTNSHGNAIGDFNDDGYLDIAVLNTAPTLFSLWQNSSGANNWIKLKLEGRNSNRDGIGSRIEVFVNGKKLIRTTHCGISYLSQNSFVETIGVGAAVLIDSLAIQWPGGAREMLYDLPVNQRFHIVEEQGITGIRSNRDTVPKKIALLQNYPNPFNGETIIDYKLTESAEIIFTVYNLHGQVVARLAQGRKTAGKHRLHFDAHSLPAGVYFYSILNARRKMILVK